MPMAPAPARMAGPLAWNTLSPMTTGPGRAARDLCTAAGEALAEAAFRTGEFAGAERLFAAARAVAERDGDRAAEALVAVGFAFVLRGRGGGLSGAQAAQGTLGSRWRPGPIQRP